MPVSLAPDDTAAEGGRWRVAGKALRLAGQKVDLRGVSYGPFPPNVRGEPFPDDHQLHADLRHIRSLGCNALRLYEDPSDTLLAACEQLGLHLLVTIPWPNHLDFLRTQARREAVEERIVRTVRKLRGHRCIAAFLVGNEIDKRLVRWMGPLRVQRFLERLIELGREEAPGHLFSYATYPSTEYLLPRNQDFMSVNVFLEQPEALSAYLQRLQNLAGNKPLIITEYGLDTVRHGEAAQAETLRWHQDCFRQAGVAGQIWFSYTDEWHRDGRLVQDWRFGLVDAERRHRPACATLANDKPRAVAAPRMSVIVCTHNGSATLQRCLESLQHLVYPDYEVLLIDDGSTHDIAVIARAFPGVRYHRQEHAGLSVARNYGASLATGEILAYTDDDCLVEEDWLARLAEAFDEPQWVAAGGPNIPPPPRNRMEAVVAAAPGAPAHVLLNDTEAEHLPGCNFAVRKAALQSIGGFHAPFTTAGDDVDICWRLRDAGGRLRFMPGAVVWHHRRFTLHAYLRQQSGYGAAEALLMKEHSQHFGPLGGARWRGAIYGDWALAAMPVEGSIFHGPLGNGLFQGIYTQGAACLMDWLSGVLWVVVAAAALLVGLWPVALLVVVLSWAMALCRMRHLPGFPYYHLATRDKMLLWWLCWLQPVVREWSRLTGMLQHQALPNWKHDLREVFIPERPRKWRLPLGELAFWSDTNVDRDRWLTSFQQLLRNEQLPFRIDDGWRWFDIELNPEGLVSPAVISVTEHHGDGRCLTRIRLLLRLRWLFLAGALATITAVILLLAAHPRYLVLTITAAVILLALSAILQRAAMRRCVLRAAREIDLQPVKPSHV